MPPLHLPYNVFLQQKNKTRVRPPVQGGYAIQRTASAGPLMAALSPTSPLHSAEELAPTTCQSRSHPVGAAFIVSLGRAGALGMHAGRGGCPARQ